MTGLRHCYRHLERALGDSQFLSEALVFDDLALIDRAELIVGRVG